MKKLVVFMLVVAMLVFSGSVLAQNTGYLETKVGLDIMGDLEVSNDLVSIGGFDVETGFTLIGEYKVPTNAQWTLGAGIAYQLDRALDTTGARDFSFTPIYGLAQYNMIESPLYLLGHLGYNMFDLDVNNQPNVNIDHSGGLYYGFGVGVNFGENNNYVAEGLYSVNNGKVEDNAGNSADVEYSKFTISLGMNF